MRFALPVFAVLAIVRSLLPIASSFAQGPFDRLKFRSVGPAGMSGRIDDLAVLERNPDVFYIATATGGLWKTENGGITLTSVFDSAATVSIGDVAIPPDDAAPPLPCAVVEPTVRSPKSGASSLRR